MPHDVRIESYGGPRDSLRPLFELAEDSAAELDSYIDAGRVPELLFAPEVRERIRAARFVGAGFKLLLKLAETYEVDVRAFASGGK